MNSNYVVVLFKNKIKKKIINEFQTLKRAQLFFDKKVKESDQTKFWVEHENGLIASYEIALLSNNKKDSSQNFIVDDLGRQVKVSLIDDDYKIINIKKFNKNEYILNYKTKKKLSFDEFISHCSKKSGLKLLSKLNNKIVFQIDDHFELFTLKNEKDSLRFLDSLEEFCIRNKMKDFLLVKDISTEQRKYLYKILVDAGFDIGYLRRKTTTHLK